MNEIKPSKETKITKHNSKNQNPSVGVQPSVRSWFNKISDKVTIGCFALCLHPRRHFPPLAEWQWTEYFIIILATIAVVIGVWYIISTLKFLREIGK